MIIDITRQTIDKILNDSFKSDAERYISSYEDFLNFVKDEGIDIAENQPEEISISSELIKSGNSGKSLFYGDISPACVDCRKGDASKTVFHTLKCNRDCYFCANMNQENYDYFSENVNDALEELIASEGQEGYKSIGLTGGEPLLMSDKVLEFYKSCQEKYPDAHKRLYTNGDFLNDDLAEKLANAGLDEIRISVKMDEDGYPAESLDALRTAKKFIPSVMVEMPVIPGTLEHMKDLLLKMDEIGCDGINILEFLYPWINNDSYKNRGFRVKNRPYEVLYSYGYAGGLPVAGSSEECLKLLQFAVDEKLKLGVHYCSLENKLTSQVYSQNAGIKLMPYEVLSDRDFFIKTARVYGSNATKARKYFEKKGISDFVQLEGRLALEFHPKYISELSGVGEVAVTYNIVEVIDGEKCLKEINIVLTDPDKFEYELDI